MRKQNNKQQQQKKTRPDRTRLALYLDNRYLTASDSCFVELVTEDISSYLKDVSVDRVLLFPHLDSYHRLLIHTVVAEGFQQLCTFSVGCEDQRRTVVCLKEALLLSAAEELMSNPSPVGPRGKSRGRHIDVVGEAHSSSNSPSGHSSESEAGYFRNKCSSSPKDGLLHSRAKAKKPEQQLYVPRARRQLDQERRNDWDQSDAVLSVDGRLERDTTMSRVRSGSQPTLRETPKLGSAGRKVRKEMEIYVPRAKRLLQAQPPGLLEKAHEKNTGICETLSAAAQPLIGEGEIRSSMKRTYTKERTTEARTNFESEARNNEYFSESLKINPCESEEMSETNSECSAVVGVSPLDNGCQNVSLDQIIEHSLCLSRDVMETEKIDKHSSNFVQEREESFQDVLPNSGTKFEGGRSAGKLTKTSCSNVKKIPSQCTSHSHVLHDLNDSRMEDMAERNSCDVDSSNTTKAQSSSNLEHLYSFNHSRPFSCLYDNSWSTDKQFDGRMDPVSTIGQLEHSHSILQSDGTFSQTTNLENYTDSALQSSPLKNRESEKSPEAKAFILDFNLTPWPKGNKNNCFPANPNFSQRDTELAPKMNDEHRHFLMERKESTKDVLMQKKKKESDLPVERKFVTQDLSLESNDNNLGEFLLERNDIICDSSLGRKDNNLNDLLIEAVNGNNNFLPGKSEHLELGKANEVSLDSKSKVEEFVVVNSSEMSVLSVEMAEGGPAAEVCDADRSQYVSDFNQHLPVKDCEISKKNMAHVVSSVPQQSSCIPSPSFVCRLVGPDEELATVPGNFSGDEVQKETATANSSKDVEESCEESKDSEMGNSGEQKEAGGNSSVEIDTDNEDSWDVLFDDNGDCVDPAILEELTTTVGKVQIQKPKINYLNYQPKDTEMDYDAYNHVIEIYDFPAEFLTRDLISAFQKFIPHKFTGFRSVDRGGETMVLDPSESFLARSQGFDIKWVDDTHALGVFSSALAAEEALSMQHLLLKVRPLPESSKKSKLKAKRCTEFLQPYKPRPKTSAATARRLVTGALGLVPRVSQEKREQERQQLREARDEKSTAVW